MQVGIVANFRGGESSTDVLTAGAGDRWTGHVILDLGAGDDVMRAGSADMTGRWPWTGSGRYRPACDGVRIGLISVVAIIPLTPCTLLSKVIACEVALFGKQGENNAKKYARPFGLSPFVNANCNCRTVW